MISIVGSTRERNAHHLFLGRESFSEKRKKSALQILAQYFGI